MNPIFKQKTVIEVWFADLENFVAEYYGQHWSFLSAIEVKANDVYDVIEVSKEEPDFYGEGESEKILQRWKDAPAPDTSWKSRSDFEQYLPSPDIILWDLCRNDVIPEGEYLIHISW